MVSDVIREEVFLKQRLFPASPGDDIFHHDNQWMMIVVN